MLTQRTDRIQRILARTNGHNRGAENLKIRQGELQSLPRDGRELRVISGQAWLTMSGRDHILGAGDSLVLSQGHEQALVSSTNGSTLRVQLQ